MAGYLLFFFLSFCYISFLDNERKFLAVFLTCPPNFHVSREHLSSVLGEFRTDFAASRVSVISVVFSC